MHTGHHLGFLQNRNLYNMYPFGNNAYAYVDCILQVPGNHHKLQFSSDIELVAPKLMIDKTNPFSKN